MIGIGAHPLAAVKEDVLRRLDVGVDARVLDAVLAAELDHLIDAAGQLPVLRRLGNVARIGAAVGLLEQSLGPVAHVDRFRRNLGQVFRIEVDVGDRGEERLDHVHVDIPVYLSLLTGHVRPEGHAFQAPYDQVLKGCRLGSFSADADLGAARSLGRLLALITEHLFHGVCLHFLVLRD